MKFIILHWSFGTPEWNWFPQLKRSLESLWQEVIIPRFPIDDWDDLLKNPSQTKTKQNLSDWLEIFKKEVIDKIDCNEPICVVAHSMWPLFFLHAIEKFNFKIDTAIFVAPFLHLESNSNFEPIDRVASTFYKTTFDFDLLKLKFWHSYVLYSENDPYVPIVKSKEFAQKLESSLIFVKQWWHMNSEVNLNEFPLVLELCKTCLDYTLYSRFLDYKSHFYTDVLNGHKEWIYTYEPNEVDFEWEFHFRNLQKSWFCTFIVWTGFWETQNNYMEEARKAAKRIGNMKRIFLLKNLDDMENISFKKQLFSDMNSGMRVGIMRYDYVKSIISNPDFGIWDENYVCIVPFSWNNVWKITMSSRKKELKIYEEAKNKILSKAFWIEKEEDLIKFVY